MSKLSLMIESAISRYRKAVNDKNSKNDALEIIRELIELKNICDYISSTRTIVDEYSLLDLPTDGLYDQAKIIIDESAKIIGDAYKTTGHSNAKYIRKDTGLSSLDDAFTHFNRKMEQNDFYMGKIFKLAVIKEIKDAILMPKFDGCAAIIRFVLDEDTKQFVVEKAMTRGVEVGYERRNNDITEKLKLLINEKFLKAKVLNRYFNNILSITVRGEIVLKDEKLTTSPPAAFVAGKINGKLELFKEGLNALEFIPFEITRVKTIEKELVPTQLEALNLFSEMNLYKAEIACVDLNSSSLDFVKQTFDKYCEVLKNPLDGVVYCCSSWQYPRNKSETLSSAFGKFAWKPCTEINTYLRSFEYDIAKDGKISVVITYDQIQAGRKNYSRAKTAISHLQELSGIGIGSEITIRLIADIMPYVDDFTLDDSIEKYRLIESCPFCDKKLIYKEDKKKCTLTCTNENCPGIRQQKLIYFLKSINFKGVGEKKIESLGDDSTLANCVKKYKLEESIIETLKRTTVRDLFVAMNFGGARQVEKYLEKTSLATYMLMPIFTCMDEVIAEVERYNKNNFAKECSLTILELMKSNKN